MMVVLTGIQLQRNAKVLTEQAGTGYGSRGECGNYQSKRDHCPDRGFLGHDYYFPTQGRLPLVEPLLLNRAKRVPRVAL